MFWSEPGSRCAGEATARWHRCRNPSDSSVYAPLSFPEQLAPSTAQVATPYLCKYPESAVTLGHDAGTKSHKGIHTLRQDFFSLYCSRSQLQRESWEEKACWFCGWCSIWLVQLKEEGQLFKDTDETHTQKSGPGSLTGNHRKCKTPHSSLHGRGFVLTQTSLSWNRSRSIYSEVQTVQLIRKTKQNKTQNKQKLNTVIILKYCPPPNILIFQCPSL